MRTRRLRRVYYVEYLYGKDFHVTKPYSEIPSPDPYAVKVPEYAYGFRIFYRIAGVAIDDDGVSVPIESAPLGMSPRYLVGGTVYTIEKFTEAFPDLVRFRTNLIRGGMTHAIVWDNGLNLSFNPDVDIQIPKRTVA